MQTEMLDFQQAFLKRFCWGSSSPPVIMDGLEFSWKYLTNVDFDESP